MRWYERNPHQLEAYDDVSGAPLKAELVTKARRFEIEFFRKMGVYEKVPRAQAWAKRQQVIGTRWIDINKGDEIHPDYRSRLVAKQFKNKLEGSAEQMFAATPPTEILRVLLSRATSGVGRYNDNKKCIMSNDVKRAYFYAPVRSDIYVEIPEEDKSEEDKGKDLVGRLRLSMYGTREAAAAWQDKIREVMLSNEFQQSMTNP